MVNLNGTSREELVQQRRDVIDACRVLLNALSHAVPNGRDYPGMPTACQHDREVHYRRYADIMALKDAVTAEAVAIQNEEQ
jgi:hypothetical protein